MIILRLADGTEMEIAWIGVSELDGSLRFEVINGDMLTLVSLFYNPKNTAVLTRVFDEDKKTFEGFTTFKGVDRKYGSGNIVVALTKE